MAYHRIRSGDTWGSIAKQYGLNETDLMGYNNATAVPPEGTRLALPTYGTSAPWQRGIGLHKSPNPEYVAPVFVPNAPPKTFGQNLWGLLTGGPSDWTKLEGGGGVTGVRGYNPTGPKPGNANIMPSQLQGRGRGMTRGGLAGGYQGLDPTLPIGEQYDPGNPTFNVNPSGQNLATGDLRYQNQGGRGTGNFNANYQPPARGPIGEGAASGGYNENSLSGIKSDMMQGVWDTPVSDADRAKMGWAPEQMQQAGYVQDQNGVWQPPQGGQQKPTPQTYKVGRGGHATYYNEQQYLNFLQRKRKITRTQPGPSDNAGNTPLSVLAQRIGSG
jgi:hypothetical protein